MKLNSDYALNVLAAVVSACVAFASGYLWYTTPERRWPYWLALGLVCCAWTARYLSRGDGRRRKVTRAIVSSGVILGISLGGVLLARIGWI